MTPGQRPIDDEAAVEAARLVRDLQEHPGWQAFLDALATREDELSTALVFGKASDNAADYATKVGEMRGLRLAPMVAESVITRGQAAAERIREEQNRSAAEEAA